MGRPSNFRQGDVTKLIKAARAAGERVREVIQSPDGEIRVLFGDPPKDERRPNDFDAEFGA